MNVKEHKVFAEFIDPVAMSQFYDAMKQDYVVRGALMPDAHVGYTLPIGSVIACDNVVVPSYIGFDLGCGMSAICTSFDKGDVVSNATKIANKIYDNIPVGFAHNSDSELIEKANELVSQFYEIGE